MFFDDLIVQSLLSVLIFFYDKKVNTFSFYKEEESIIQKRIMTFF